jgi:predicted porin
MVKEISMLATVAATATATATATVWRLEKNKINLAKSFSFSL